MMEELCVENRDIIRDGMDMVGLSIIIKGDAGPRKLLYNLRKQFLAFRLAYDIFIVSYNSN